MPRVRVHQHVNPLAPYYRFTPQPVEIKQIFANPELPLHLDIGSARGRFVLKMAEIEKSQQNEFFEEVQISVNPFPVKTERELAVEEKRLPVYRRIFIKK